MFRRVVYVLVALAGCKDPKSKATEPAQAVPVVVKDQAGTTVAELRPTRPCRATIGPIELIVGGPPLIATLGSTQWAGVGEPNGTILTRDGERIARIYPAPGTVGDAASVAVFDMHGVAKIRVKVTGQVARVEDSASIPVRRLTLADGTITVDAPALTVTGTNDLVLAALLSAPEVLPEVRMLAACERVLAKGPTK